jgi:hypothetical protein
MMGSSGEEWFLLTKRSPNHQRAGGRNAARKDFRASAGYRGNKEELGTHNDVDQELYADCGYMDYDPYGVAAGGSGANSARSPAAHARANQEQNKETRLQMRSGQVFNVVSHPNRNLSADFDRLNPDGVRVKRGIFGHVFKRQLPDYAEEENQR